MWPRHFERLRKDQFRNDDSARSFQGWKIWTIGDDIAWMRPGKDGRLTPFNPENGYFGVAPGTNMKSNPNAMASIARDTIYTNVALTAGWRRLVGRQRWRTAGEATDWRDSPDTSPHRRESLIRIAGSPRRWTNNPMLAPEANDPNGVPISAIIFGGGARRRCHWSMKRSNWVHGVYMGATMGSETYGRRNRERWPGRRDRWRCCRFAGTTWVFTSGIG